MHGQQLSTERTCTEVKMCENETDADDESCLAPSSFDAWLACWSGVACVMVTTTDSWFVLRCKGVRFETYSNFQSEILNIHTGLKCCRKQQCEFAPTMWHIIIIIVMQTWQHCWHEGFLAQKFLELHKHGETSQMRVEFPLYSTQFVSSVQSSTSSYCDAAFMNFWFCILL